MHCFTTMVSLTFFLLSALVSAYYLTYFEAPPPYEFQYLKTL